MRIAYDHQIFSSQFYGGISRYFYNLANTLSQSGQLDLAVIAPLYHNAYLKSALPFYVKGSPILAIPKAQRFSQGISALLAPRSMRVFKPDIVHETYYQPGSYVPKTARCVVTIHDMIHEKYPSMVPNSHKERQAKKVAIERADFIICVSENTRRDLLNLCDIPAAKTATVHHGYDMPDSHFSGIRPVYQPPARYRDRPQRLEKPYLLYVGARWRYKNFDNLLQAYADAPWIRHNFNLVCFGGGSFDADEIQRMVALGLTTAQVIQVNGDDQALVQAYEAAAAFVYPSLYEGFGMPILEAMSLNCPVICSNTSSIPEVGGHASEYFDPKDPADIAAAIERVLGSTDRRDQLIALGRQQCQQFSWKKCAQETFNVYRQVLCH
jgi:glycosyltransferase involved in cell wall biosynthesis